MKRFTAQLSDGGYMNVSADRMEISSTDLFVYLGESLVAYLDLGAVLTAHLSEKG